MRRHKQPTKHPSKTIVDGKIASNTKPETLDDQKLEQTCACGYDNALPWWLPWLIVVVTAVTRINYVIKPENGWILHPDEIYQSVEIAFSEVYGYGFRPYEYLPPPPTNTTIPTEQHDLQSGMYALRSFIYPSIFTAVLTVAKYLSVDDNPLLVCKIFNVLFTSTLPLTVYMCVERLYNCRLVSITACAMTASCCQLVVFGTHTIVNSFLAPPVFLALSLCLPASISDAYNIQRKPGIRCSDSTVRATSSRPRVTRNNSKTNSPERHVRNEQSGGSAEHCSTQHESIYQLNSIFQFVQNNIFTSKYKACIGGFLSGITCYIRPDTSVFIIATLTPVYVSSWRSICNKTIHLKFVTIGSIFAAIIGIMIDFHKYGFYVISPYQWFKFNLVSGKAFALFGSDGVKIYYQVLVPDIINLVVNICAVIILIYSLKSERFSQHFKNSIGAQLLTFTILFSIYNTIGHNEARFIHNLFVLQVILLSFALHSLIILVKSRVKVIMLLFGLIYSSTAYYNFPDSKHITASGWSYGNAQQSRDVNLCLNFIRHQTDVKGVMVNASVYNFAGLTVLKQDVPFLVKIHNEFHLYSSAKSNRLSKYGGIRILSDFSDFVHTSNHRYIKELLTNTDSLRLTFNYVISFSHLKSHLNLLKYKSVAKFGNYAVYHKPITDLNEATSTPLLPAHNVMPANGNSEANGFNTDNDDQLLTTNATVLEYEANWLITNGLYTKAVERIGMAMTLGLPRVRLFHQMMVCYNGLGQREKVYEYERKCYQVHGREECNKQQQKIVLHDEYSQLD